jgi:hypothetical protein
MYVCMHVCMYVMYVYLFICYMSTNDSLSHVCPDHFHRQAARAVSRRSARKHGVFGASAVGPCKLCNDMIFGRKTTAWWVCFLKDDVGWRFDPGKGERIGKMDSKLGKPP